VGKTFREHVGDLRGSVDWFNFYCPLFDVLAEMMVLEGDVASAGANFGGICQFQGACIVFEYGAGTSGSGKEKVR
jgi:hypothetical protein